MSAPELVPLKRVATLNDEKLTESTDPERLMRYIDIGAVGRGALVEPPAEMTFAESPSRARRLVKAGDTIVSTVRTYLRSVWPVVDDCPDTLVVSTGFTVVRPRTADPGFLSWVLQSDLFIEEVVARSVGVSYPAINPDALASIGVPVPTMETQQRVARFLDAETGRIDDLIAAKERTADLLEERRWSAFVDQLSDAQAVSVPVRRVLETITDGPFGSAFSSSEYVDAGVAVVRLGNIGFASWRGEDLACIPGDRYAEFERHGVHEGDVLIAGLGDANNHAGRACVAPELGPAIVKGKCFCARVDRSLMRASSRCFSPLHRVLKRWRSRLAGQPVR